MGRLQWYSVIKDYREEKKICDVIIRIPGAGLVLWCHQIILAAVFKYFELEFNKTLTLSSLIWTKTEFLEFTLEDIDGGVFSELVEMVYQGQRLKEPPLAFLPVYQRLTMLEDGSPSPGNLMSTTLSRMNLSRFRSEALLCDDGIRVRGKIFRCHRVVLSAGFGYFWILLSNSR